MATGNRFAAFAAGFLFAASLVGAPVSAADYPNKPVKLIVTFPPGGGMDTMARLLYGPLQDRLKQPVVVDNQPGAGGGIAARTVAQAPADGYTWMVAPNNVMIFAPLLFGLDALDHDAQAEPLREPAHRFDDRARRRVGRDVLGEAAVDLDLREGVLREVAER